MEDFIRGIAKLRGDIFPGQRQLYEALVRDGQTPKALIIACAGRLPAVEGSAARIAAPEIAGIIPMAAE